MRERGSGIARRLTCRSDVYALESKAGRLPSERRYRAREAAQRSGTVRVAASVMQMIEGLLPASP